MAQRVKGFGLGAVLVAALLALLLIRRARATEPPLKSLAPILQTPSINIGEGTELPSAGFNLEFEMTSSIDIELKSIAVITKEQAILEYPTYPSVELDIVLQSGIPKKYTFFFVLPPNMALGLYDIVLVLSSPGYESATFIWPKWINIVSPIPAYPEASGDILASYSWQPGQSGQSGWRDIGLLDGSKEAHFMFKVLNSSSFEIPDKHVFPSIELADQVANVVYRKRGLLPGDTGWFTVGPLIPPIPPGSYNATIRLSFGITPVYEAQRPIEVT